MQDVSGIPIDETPVLIVGSSMVGMTLSALLAKHGIRNCIAIEKHAGTAIHPRAALFHPRTMQIYRELGLYEQMKDESAKHYDQHAGLYNVETLADGLEGGKIETFMADINEGLEDISPTSRLFLTQQLFEPLLRKHALEHGASLRFSTKLLDFQQNDDGVTALVEDTETGIKRVVKAMYMVACDGSRSLVREKLDIGMEDHGLLSRSITIYFRADLSRFVEGRYNGVIYVNNEHVRGFFRLDKSGTEGFLVVNTYGPRNSESSRYPSDGITTGKASEILSAAIGADVDFEITLLSPWDAVCGVARSFSAGRVLLAGDAAHTMTPHGGFGGNTGIQDAHNLAISCRKEDRGSGLC
jgi:2-polyprenyl-6-methoxyphenol hydroxylase-like FAD-dependent oxidoreductase